MPNRTPIPRAVRDLLRKGGWRVGEVTARARLTTFAIGRAADQFQRTRGGETAQADGQQQDSGDPPADADRTAAGGRDRNASVG